MSRAALPVALAAAALGVVGFGEISSWAASRSGYPSRRPPTRTGGPESPRGRHAVVILGYRNPGDRANAINRFRVRAGVRSMDPRASESVLVLCGGAVAGAVPEAELLARCARDLGFTGPIRLEQASTSTEENIEQAIPLLEEATSIAVVSTSHHALKARICLRRLRPDLAERLVRGGDYRLGELWWVKPVEAVLGRRSLRRLTSAG
ncbi:YdcF family protein [Brevibacterium casei]|uniref:YdcF family protein n=1 Tax=Brevibacterium casei TaxID=33889 RepID=UPI003EB9EA15